MDQFEIVSYISLDAPILKLALINISFYLMTRALGEGKATSRYPWLTPQFYTDSLQTLLNRSYNSLELELNRIYLSCIVFLNTPRSIVSFISWLYLCKVLVNAILLLLLLYFNPESFLLDFDMVQGCHLISDQELKTLNQLDIECDKVKDYFRQEVRSGNHARASVYEHCFNAYLKQIHTIEGQHSIPKTINNIRRD